MPSIAFQTNSFEGLIGRLNREEDFEALVVAGIDNGLNFKLVLTTAGEVFVSFPDQKVFNSEVKSTDVEGLLIRLLGDEVAERNNYNLTRTFYQKYKNQ